MQLFLLEIGPKSHTVIMRNISSITAKLESAHLRHHHLLGRLAVYTGLKLERFLLQPSLLLLLLCSSFLCLTYGYLSPLTCLLKAQQQGCLLSRPCGFYNKTDVELALQAGTFSAAARPVALPTVQQLSLPHKWPPGSCHMPPASASVVHSSRHDTSNAGNNTRLMTENAIHLKWAWLEDRDSCVFRCL